MHLGMGDITDLHQVSGTLPVSKHRLHNLCKNEIKLPSLRTSPGMPLGCFFNITNRALDI